MLRKAKPEKPEKPYKTFPLTAHPNGQWCKKIKGELHYFGAWADPDSALEQFLADKDALYAGREPKPTTDGLSLKELMSHFLDAKQLLVESGEMEQRSLNDLKATCVNIGKSLGLNRPVDDLDSRDFQQLRKDIGRGKRVKQHKAGTLKGNLTRARMVFKYAVENGLVTRPLLYRDALKTPSKAKLRQEASENGPRMFERGEIQSLIDSAEPQLKAMIYLALNCGFGNKDCALLQFKNLDLESGWHNYGRKKTGIERRGPLWPETVAAINEATAVRPDPRSEQEAGYIFLTRCGQNWAKHGSALSAEFRKLAKKVKVYRRGCKVFYSIRRTHETIGAATGQQVAVDFLMGHSRPDMASVYRQRVFNSRLVEVSNFIRGWLLGEIELD